MIVGTTNINNDELKSIVNNNEDIVDYAESLVPLWARHLRGVIHNQRYYVAVLLRNVTSIPYKTRRTHIDKLLDGIALSGVANNVCSVYDILDMCDKDKLIEALERGTEN